MWGVATTTEQQNILITSSYYDDVGQGYVLCTAVTIPNELKVYYFICGANLIPDLSFLLMRCFMSYFVLLTCPCLL